MTKAFVLLIDSPAFFSVESNLNRIFSISSMIQWVFHNICIFHVAVKLHLEKVISAKVVHVFRTVFNVVNEHFYWVEWMTKLTLTCHRMLVTLWIHLKLAYLFIQLSILILLPGHSITQSFVRFNYFIRLVFLNECLVHAFGRDHLSFLLVVYSCH